MVERKNVADISARKDFIDGVKALKHEVRAGHPLTTYDRYVLWHLRAMHTATPPGNPGGRNAAHSGPIFLPWHRQYLIRLERDLQRVLGKPDFGLPYWDWAADAELPDPRTAPIWRLDALGPEGQPVSQGPFAFDAADPGSSDSWTVRVGLDRRGRIQTNLEQGLQRTLGLRASELPKRGDVSAALLLGTYDSRPWARRAPGSFRDKLEGWAGVAGPELHNLVHVWVGGDMIRGHSPNDPVFFLHHANVDRIWAAWLRDFPGTPYAPDQSQPDTLRYHRIADPMFPMDGADPAVTAAQMLDYRVLYQYDELPTVGP